MYLYVFILLLIAVIGSYTQVFVLRVSRMEANKTAVAEVMYLWHGEARRVAKENLAIFSSGTSCALSRDVAPRDMPATTLDCSTVITPPANLTAQMMFNSIAYRIPIYGVDTDYVVTFVKDVNGFAKAGYNQNEILRQMQKAGYSSAIIGETKVGNCNLVIGGSWLMTAAKAGADDVCYPTRYGATLFVPNNVVGIISVL